MSSFHDLEKNKINVSSSFDGKNGVITLSVDENPIIQNKLNIVLSIDRSGSMINVMDNVKQCLLNIIYYLKDVYYEEFEKESELHLILTIIAFDHKLKYICKELDIKDLTNDSLLEDITKNINQLHARGLTNIENVFNDIDKFYKHNYTNCHIFMTDGEPTEGEEDREKLCKIINKTGSKFDHSFLGFGIEHNSRILEYFMKNIQDSQYFYIDNIENAGMIYGEILHKVMYTKYQNIELSSDGCDYELYDPKTGEWCRSIKANSMGSGDKYIYNYRLNPKDSDIDDQLQEKTLAIYYNLVGSNRQTKYVTSLLDAIEDTIEDTNREVLDTIKNRPIVIDLMREYQEIFDIKSRTSLMQKKEKTLYERLNSLFDELSQKNETVDDKNKKLHQQLLDDLYIHIKLFNNKHSHMFCFTRYNAQVNQISYNITNINNCLRTTRYFEDEDHIYVNNLNRHSLSQDPYGAFVTPYRSEMMRNVSIGGKNKS